MKHPTDSPRQNKRALNRYAAGHPRSCPLNSALDVKRPLRDGLRGERRKRTSEHERHDHSGRSPHSSEMDARVPPGGCVSGDDARQAGGRRSRPPLRSDATDPSRPVGSAFGQRFEMPDSELHGLVAAVDETEVKAGDFEAYILVAVDARSGLSTGSETAIPLEEGGSEEP